MRDEKQRKKLNLKVSELDGNMLLIDEVEILDISFGGVSLKTESQLHTGKEYLITLAEKGRRHTVKGVVVHSQPGGTAERSNGEKATLYTAGMRFENGQRDEISAFLDSLEQNKIPETPTAVERRRTARIHITFPLDTILSHSARFTVIKISMRGMLIQCDQALALHSMVPMGLSLDAHNQVNFSGKVSSCRMRGGRGKTHYEIGVEFADLDEKDRALLTTFIDYVAATGMRATGEKEANR